MATSKAPDLVTLANLHAALDSVLEIESLLERTQFPPRAIPAAPRLNALANEMRTLLVELLHRP